MADAHCVKSVCATICCLLACYCCCQHTWCSKKQKISSLLSKQKEVKKF